MGSIQTFSMRINLKVNFIAQLEFELASHNTTVHHVRIWHYGDSLTTIIRELGLITKGSNKNISVSGSFSLQDIKKVVFCAAASLFYVKKIKQYIL